MAGWISSKLKVAETFLQQIDQQAAESLRKNEKNRDEEVKYEAPAKTETVVPLKDQLKKRASQEINEISSASLSKDSVSNEGNRKVVTPPPPPKQSSLDSKPMPALTDSDWTELLSGPKQPSPSSAIRSNGLGSIRGPLKDVKKSLEAKKQPQRRSNGSGYKSAERSDIGSSGGGAASAKRSDGEESGSGDSAQMRSGSEAPNDDVYVGEMGKSSLEKNVGQTVDGIAAIESVPVAAVVDGATVGKKQVDGNCEQLGIEKSDVVARSSTTDVHSSSSDEGTSGSDTDSSSSSESESERERKAERARRKERIMAEKAAAKAIEAIKDRENMVARLEGEKQSLEKILEERSRQQAQEASELQMSMTQTMNAVELEKQKHSNTRMEALTRLAKLETSNADLARSLATIQWNLEIEVNRVIDLRQELELKEVIHEELMKKMSKIQQSKSSPNRMEASKGVEFEQEILEAEYAFTCDKVKQLQEKAKKLEENIEITRKEMEDPTEVEVELKRRLGQLTDHLIQKQAQVEALSSEKATLLFRIETVSRLLEERKSSQQLSDLAGPSSRDDLEAGNWEVSNSKLRPLLAGRIQSGSQHFALLLRQLNSLYCAGSALLRRNSAAKFWSLFYFVCLHFWVAYILMSDSKASDTVSGAVVSLETINKTTGS